MAGKRKPIKLSKKELKYRTRLELVRSTTEPTETVESAPMAKKTVVVPNVVPVRKLAELSGLGITDIIKALFKNGVMATINESIDFETAVLIGDDLGLDIVADTPIEETAVEKNTKGATRAPVVTVMGHVDHGKTLLLDAIRQTNVVATESGGITQHIGAYQIETEYEKKKRTVTFLDTPGHEAFSALRAHGANLTDVVVLVVAADDGIKAQTLEAISHARAAQVPIIVAINKIDLPAADPDRVKRELSEHGLLPEEWGGTTPVILVSAKEKKNIKQLLEMILLVADLKELTADATTAASGTVIESHMDAGVGTLATVLVQQGTIKSGQIIVIGSTWGKIRFLEDWNGKRIIQAGPSTPVRIAGLKAVPAFGERFVIATSVEEAKKMLESRATPTVVRSISEQTGQEYRLIIRADVVGSLEAIKASLDDIPQDKIKIKILSDNIGAISESDVNLAITTGSIIYGFRSTVPKNVLALAQRSNVDIKLYDTIYKLIEDLRASIEGSMNPEITEETIGKLQVLKVFFQTKENIICGGKVIWGKMEPILKVRIIRDDKVIGNGKITSLKVGPTEVDQVAKGDECGLNIFNNNPTELKIKENDILEAFTITKKINKLSDTKPVS